MRKALKDDAKIYDLKENGVHDENRHCETCNRKLSRYNPNDKCYACLHQELQEKINATPPVTVRKPYTRKYEKVQH